MSTGSTADGLQGPNRASRDPLACPHCGGTDWTTEIGLARHFATCLVLGNGSGPPDAEVVRPGAKREAEDSAPAATTLPLYQCDLEMFQRLGIPRDLLQKAGIRRVSDREAREKLGICTSGDHAGIFFPYWDPDALIDGNRIQKYWRLRRDNPEIVNGKPERKYTSPYGDRKRLYFPPAPELFADTSVPIVLVEAEKSALALLAWSERVGRKVLSVAMGGCWGWRGQVGIKQTATGDREPEKGPLRDLNICRDGRITYVLLDANCETNPKVLAARKALVQQLRRQGAGVVVLNLPTVEGVNGPDDYIAQSGDEAMAQVMDGGKTGHDSEQTQGKYRFELTDYGNAERLAANHGQDLHYCQGKGLNSAGIWFVWDGGHWKPDTLLQVMDFAKRTVRGIQAEALGVEDFEARKKLVQFGLASESDARIRAMISIARSERGIPIVRSAFDSDLMLLSTPNATLQLETRTVREHRREDLITKVTKARYDPEECCPRWLQFLDEVTNHSTEFIRYLQQLAGLSLTGVTKDHLFMILWGEGQTGKSTFLETLSYVLGEYALTADVDTFMITKGDRVRNDVARLHGARFITANESELGQKLAEALIKSLTGGDTVSARFLYEESFEFKPQAKFWLRTNYKPVIRGQDSGIWRRVRLVPFITPVPEDRKDRDLPEKLRNESSGILNWMLEGLADYLVNGLAEPREVTKATQAYRAEEDVIQQFIDGWCVVNPNAKAGKNELYQAYEEWAEKNGLYAKNALLFRADLLARRIEEARGHGGARYWRGIGLKNNDPQSEEDGLPFG